MAKKYIIGINWQTETSEEMADLLRHIAGMIEGGYTSGYYPHWELEEQEDEENEDD